MEIYIEDKWVSCQMKGEKASRKYNVELKFYDGNGVAKSMRYSRLALGELERLADSLYQEGFIQKTSNSGSHVVHRTYSRSN